MDKKITNEMIKRAIEQADANINLENTNTFSAQKSISKPKVLKKRAKNGKY